MQKVTLPVVRSLATIYSGGSDTDEFRLREFLANVKDPQTGKKIGNMEVAHHPILFYGWIGLCGKLGSVAVGVVKNVTFSFAFVFISGRI